MKNKVVTNLKQNFRIFQKNLFSKKRKFNIREFHTLKCYFRENKCKQKHLKYFQSIRISADFIRIFDFVELDFSIGFAFDKKNNLIEIFIEYNDQIDSCGVADYDSFKKIMHGINYNMQLEEYFDLYIVNQLFKNNDDICIHYLSEHIIIFKYANFVKILKENRSILEKQLEIIKKKLKKDYKNNIEHYSNIISELYVINETLYTIIMKEMKYLEKGEDNE